ncbi:DUF7668 domain-containing protein [Maricaulis maris]|uniref:DUF7668 domain-containing protein n=1 Tax=Maricaulis maris TaxID=74318 RepID=UPI003B8E0685
MMTEGVQKNSDRELPVPKKWRPMIADIVGAIVRNDFSFEDLNVRVEPPSEKLQDYIRESIGDYGCTLIALRADVWKHAVYICFEDHWQVIVDLCSEEEGVSDLALHLKVHDDIVPKFEISSVHVP